MIVDSSALTEQVVQDVLSSGFDSAGQRCSALRVLCLQHEIADSTLALLKAALQELRIGDPARFSTDIGPVIDGEAQSRLHAHIEEMRSRGCPVAQLPLPTACAEGSFVAPTLIEIERLSQLPGEVFGPVVHVLRFNAARLPQLVEEINATGYGLTLGLHSRIDETIATVVAGARVGNLYVNRNMVGAVVGVQPFGGDGLSGTGPKAGGPLYLPQLAGSPRLDAAALGLAGVPTAALAALHAWAQANGYRELAARCAEDGAASLLGSELALPGPTGERNTLRFAPRGRLFCLGATLAERLRQLAALLATGNRAALSATDEHRELLAQLPPAVSAEIELRAPDALAGLAGVLAVDTPDLRRRTQHATLRPPRPPVLSRRDTGRAAAPTGCGAGHRQPRRAERDRRTPGTAGATAAGGERRDRTAHARRLGRTGRGAGCRHPGLAPATRRRRRPAAGAPCAEPARRPLPAPAAAGRTRAQREYRRGRRQHHLDDAGRLKAAAAPLRRGAAGRRAGIFRHFHGRPWKCPFFTPPAAAYRAPPAFRRFRRA